MFRIMVGCLLLGFPLLFENKADAADEKPSKRHADKTIICK
jgi:hypothetical protein